MDNKMSTTIFSFTVVFLLVRQVRTDVSCKAGSFAVGSKGSVVCHFGKDVADRNFNVVRYSGETGDAGDYVLLCNWVNNKRECTVKSGYEFDYIVSTTLTLGIPKVTENLAGMYVCQLVPDADNARVLTCHLNLTAATTAAPKTISNAPPPPNKGTPSSEAQADTPDAKEGGFPASAVVLLVVLILVLVVVVLSVLFIRHNNTIRKRDVEHQDGNTANSGCFKALERFAINWKLLPPPAPSTEPSPPTEPPPPKPKDIGVGEHVVTTMDEEVQATMKPETTDRGTETERKVTVDKRTYTDQERLPPAVPVDKAGNPLPFSPLAVVNRQPNTAENTDHRRSTSAGPRNSQRDLHLEKLTQEPQRLHSTTEGATDRTDGKRSSQRDEEEYESSDNDAEDQHRSLTENKNEESERLLADARTRPDKIHTRTDSAQGKPDDDTNPVPPLMREQPPRVNTTEFPTWDNKDVCEWLKKVGLERWVGKFQDKNMTGINLVQSGWFSTYRPISQSDLKSMGIKAKVDQQAVQRAIDALIKGD